MAETLNEDHQRAGLGGHLSFGTRPALVVDVAQALARLDQAAAQQWLQADARAAVRRRADDIMGR